MLDNIKIARLRDAVAVLNLPHNKNAVKELECAIETLKVGVSDSNYLPTVLKIQGICPALSIALNSLYVSPDSKVNVSAIIARLASNAECCIALGKMPNLFANLIAILTSPSNNDSSKADVAFAIRVLAGNLENRRNIGQFVGVYWGLDQLLSSDFADDRAKAEAACAMSRLALDEENCSLMGKSSKAISNLVMLLETDDLGDQAKTQALIALQNLSKNPSNKAILTRIPGALARIEPVKQKNSILGLFAQKRREATIEVGEQQKVLLPLMQNFISIENTFSEQVYPI